MYNPHVNPTQPIILAKKIYRVSGTLSMSMKLPIYLFFKMKIFQIAF